MRSVPLLLLTVLSVCLVGQSRLRDDPRTLAIAKMLQPVTAELKDARLEDAFVYLEQVSGVTIEAQWRDEDPSGVGLDRDALITLSAQGMDRLALLERLLDAGDDEFDAATWQATEAGTIMAAPRSALNRRAFVKLYDVQDLLVVIPHFTDVPDLELGSIVQGQGGSEQDSDIDIPAEASEQELMDRLVEIIQTSVEFDQWRDNGGDGASITPYRDGALLVRAPGYIHRQLGGLEYWPTAAEVRRVSQR